MPPARSFYSWLQEHHGRDTRYGDLARDARADKEFPRESDDYQELRRYLDFTAASETLRDAYAEWAGVGRGIAQRRRRRR